VTDEVKELWERALKARRSATRNLAEDPDLTASRSYYAVFYAVSALFILRGRDFRKHSAVESAVHRDLVRTGEWAVALGADYSALVKARETGDYGVLSHISVEDAGDCLAKADAILEAVKRSCPDLPSPGGASPQ